MEIHKMPNSLTQKTLTVLLIEDSAEYAELVQQWLSVKGEVRFLLNWTDSLAAGIERLAHGGVDAILLDLNLPDSQGLDTFRTVRGHARGVSVILLSGSDTDSVALEMVQQGAQDYLVKSTCTGELLRKAVQYAVIRHESQARKGPDAAVEQSRVIGVLGAHGGVGATTIACGLAMQLRVLTNQTTLLADLDLNAGLVNFFMKSQSEYSMLDAVSNMQRLDRSCWEGLVWHAPGDLHVIGSPGMLGACEADADALRHVLTVLPAFYRWMVIDLGRLSVLSTGLLDRMNEILLVTTTSLSSLYETKRVIGALARVGIEAERIRLIVNEVRTSQALSGSELNQMLGIPVYARLPGASQELHEACMVGRVLPEAGEFLRQITHLARRIAGLPETKARSKVSQFLSFGDRSRRAGAPHG